MKVLVAPLDWGLGHATRSIPVIREFLSRGWTVDLAVSGKSMAALYRGEFPELSQVEIPGYSIRYPARGFEMPFWLLKNYRRILNVIRREQSIAEELVQKRSYDLLFSDNRFGFHSARAFSVYMTHQLRIAFPRPFSAFEKIGIAWHQKRMRNFDAVWVPDVPEFPGLSGKLSHGPFSQNVTFVGPLSRFLPVNGSETSPKKFRFAALISGPEPSRSRFEERLLSAFREIPGRHAVIRGCPGSVATPKSPPNVELFNHLETADFQKTVLAAETVVSRPGYSTVMDMACLGAKCVFVPTPGQTEQVYLGRELFRSRAAGLVFEQNFSAQNLLSAEQNLRGPLTFHSAENRLSLAVENLTAQIQRNRK